MKSQHTRQRIRHNRRGFTLIEVLLVLVILVMLGSLAVGVYSQVQLNAMKRDAKAQIKLFKTPIEVYQQDMLAYPPDLHALVTPDGLDTPEDWEGPYLENVPLDPWKQEYRYRSPGEYSRTYDIWSCGPNREDENGGGDDIGNWTQE